jgi:hypothetical protein
VYGWSNRVKWEYKTIKLYPTDDERDLQLRRAGAEGWELVSVSYNMAYFKRTVPQHFEKAT